MADANEPKKETVRITLPPRSTAGEPSDTVRINLPPKARLISGAKQAEAPIPPRPSTRLPVRPPAFTPLAGVPVPPPSSTRPLRPPAPAAPSSVASSSPDAPPSARAGDTPPMPPRPRVLPPAPRVIPPSAASPGVSAAPANYPGSAPQTGPKQETARISNRPEPVRPARAVKMSKTQPLLTVPAPIGGGARVVTRASNYPSESSGVGATPGGIDSIPMPLIWAAFGISAVTLIIQIWNYFGS